jgi:hypothetical protein
MAEHQMLEAIGRIPVIETANLAVRAANADFQHAKLYLGRTLDFGLGMIDQAHSTAARIYGNSFHWRISGAILEFSCC